MPILEIFIMILAISVIGCTFFQFYISKKCKQYIDKKVVLGIIFNLSFPLIIGWLYAMSIQVSSGDSMESLGRMIIFMLTLQFLPFVNMVIILSTHLITTYFVSKKNKVMVLSEGKSEIERG